jgi:hypothetical protein
VAYDRRHHLKSSSLGSAPPPFSGDKLVPIVHGTNHNRLQDTPILYGGSQLCDVLFGDLASGLKSAGADFMKGQITNQPLVKRLATK